MIQVVNFPAANRFLLDGNNTQITVTSSNGAGHYFRAKIYINNQLFDEQGWSRQDDFTATKDLIYLYHAYFNPYFIGTFDQGLFEQVDFSKKVTIIIEERLIATDAVVATATLPDFYIIYNAKSETFDDSQKLTILGLNPGRLRIKLNGVISIPFFVNLNNESVSVVVKDHLNNVLYSQLLASQTGKKMFIFNCNLALHTLLSSTTHLIVEVSAAETTITKVYNIIQLPQFEVKELVYQNNFGFYIPAYFDGEFQDERGFEVNTYEEATQKEVVYAIDENGTYTINTGSLNVQEKEIVRLVANSLDVWFKNGNTYRQVVPKIKKTTYDKSRTNIFEEDLVFSFKEGLPFTNNLSIDVVTPSLVLDSVTPTTGIFFDLAFTANFPFLQLFSQVRLNSSFNWSTPFTHGGIVSPQSRAVSLGGNFQIRLFAVYNGVTIFSNVVTYSSVPTNIVNMPDVISQSFTKTIAEAVNQETSFLAFTEAKIFEDYSNTESNPYASIRIIAQSDRGAIALDGALIVTPITIPVADIIAGRLQFWPIGLDGNQPYVVNQIEQTSFTYIVVDSTDYQSQPVLFEIQYAITP